MMRDKLQVDRNPSHTRGIKSLFSNSTLLLLGAVLTFTPAPLDELEIVPLFILAGQSNAVGYRVNWSNMPAIPLPQHRLVFWYSQGDPRQPRRSARWVALASDEHRTLASVGAELSIGLSAANQFDSAVGIIKLAYNGAALGEVEGPDWNIRSGELFSEALLQLESAMLRQPTGVTFTPAGLFWIQGESDAKNGPTQPELANAYRHNLAALIEGFREAVETPRLPVVIARISVPERDAIGRNFGYREIVRKAQAESAASHADTVMINTDDLSRQADDLHFDATGQIELGKRLFAAWQTLSANRH